MFQRGVYETEVGAPRVRKSLARCDERAHLDGIWEIPRQMRVCYYYTQHQHITASNEDGARLPSETAWSNLHRNSPQTHTSHVLEATAAGMKRMMH